MHSQLMKKQIKIKVNASASPNLMAVADSNFIDVLVEQVRTASLCTS